MKYLMLLTLLVVATISQAQIINFPDVNFKNALVNTNCVDTNGDYIVDSDADLNNDNEIDKDEALKVSLLEVKNNLITSIEGIENFSNLTHLFCENNFISNMNVKALSKLVQIKAKSNALTTVMVDNLQSLVSIDISLNQNLEKLNVNGNIKLEKIFCTNSIKGSLKILTMENCGLLREVSCRNNQLDSLDFSSSPFLRDVNCELNNLRFVNILNNKSLINLYAAGNQLTNIDISNNLALRVLSLERNKFIELNLNNHIYINQLNITYNNELERLFIKNGRKEFTYVNDPQFYLYENQNLKYVCVDEIEMKDITNKIKDVNIIGCEVNTYCNFEPGGISYIIRGQNIFDSKNDGCSLEDIAFPKIKYNITKDNISGTFISNNTGSYTLPLQSGTYLISTKLQNSEAFEVTPSILTITFPNTSDTITQNFCITPKNVLHQLVISVIPVGTPARPGFDSSYKIILENKGNQIENGTLNFRYDEAILDFVSASQIPDFIADGLLKWDFSQLLPFERKEYIVKLNLNSPVETPPVNAGDKIYLTASIFDNVFSLEQTVVGSYDPNDKTCLQGDRIKPDMIGKYVDYLVRFENTGNYAAENVVVKDFIDTTRFDVSSLQITDASHEVYTRITGNKVEFIFENIQLPFDDAHNDGYIAFKIKTLPNLVVGNSLKNLADIYFDYNFPIRTNEAQSVIALPVVTHDIEVSDIRVYPNPVKDIIYFGMENEVSKAEIFDINGRIIRSSSVTNNQLNIADIEKGVYLIKIYIPQASQYVKIVKI